MTTNEQTSSAQHFGSSFAGGVSGVGVASLDSPLVNETKSEIRALAREIAGLADSRVTSDDFYSGFLPRLAMAMGAAGAAVWRVEYHDQNAAGEALQASFRLESEHQLASELLDASDLKRPTTDHENILRVVASGGRPILIPPNSVAVEADRPKNPLPNSLVVIPVALDADVTHLLEVVHVSSGGAAAQRGYLRFVSQMADLMADFLRRQQLRELLAAQERTGRLRTWLLQLAGAGKLQDRQLIAANALRDLLEAAHITILRGRKARVCALSGVQTWDPRSELVEYGQRLARLVLRSEPQTVSWLEPGQASDENASTESQKKFAAAIHPFSKAVGCEVLCALQLTETEPVLALVGYRSRTSRPTQWDDQEFEQLARAVGGLLRPSEASSWRPRLCSNARSGTHHARNQVQAWGMRVALAAALVAIAWIPVPQQVTATAVLKPKSKRAYYAPLDSVVSEVFVDEGDSVQANQRLLQLRSPELENEVDATNGDLRKTKDRITELAGLRSRGSDLTSQESDRIEGEISQLQTTAATLERQLAILREQQAQLSLVARVSGTVSSWDMRNRLMLRPVQAGQLLATTFEPDGEWALQLSVPDTRVGLVMAAMSQEKDANRNSARVQFSLTSHPDQMLQADLTRLASHATRGTLDPQGSQSVVLAEAELDAATLPIRKDGAIARASIDCGSVPLYWLVIRDAYWAVTSRFKMLW